MKILGVCGSAREPNQSSVMLEVVLSAARAAGAQTETLNLFKTPLPLFRVDAQYDRDYPIIGDVRTLCEEADAFVLVTPEYHGSMSGWMKNFFDFHYNEFAGKAFALVASTGGSLGESCLSHMRASVQYCHGWALPYHSAARPADFDAAMQISMESVTKRLEFLGRDLAVYGKILKEKFDSDKSEGGGVGFAAWHR